MRPRTLDEIVGPGRHPRPGRAAPARHRERRPAVAPALGAARAPARPRWRALIADLTQATFVPFSAVLSGIKEIREVMAAAQDRRRRTGRRTIVFVDEIHRFNKAQQDAFLPRVEAGDIVLIGATTENPSFEVNAALLSRSKVFVLQPLQPDAVIAILQRAIDDRDARAWDSTSASTPEVLPAIARFASGDARAALNFLEFAAATAPMDPETCVRQLDLPHLERSIQRRALLYDKTGEEHYNLISALHKSMRNSDPDAAVYWVSRMLEAGEDPLYVARRLVRFASEDIGNADPQALVVAVAAKDAAHFIGMPEGNTALAQAAIYLATAPKSNAVYTAYNAAAADAQTQVAEPVPLHLRNAPTKLMKTLDYGKGYAVRARRRGGHDGDGLPAAVAGREEVLQADGARLRKRDQAPPRWLGGAEEKAAGVVAKFTIHNSQTAGLWPGAVGSYRFTNFCSVAFTESATKISPFGLIAITCASPNSPGPLPGLPSTASTLPFRSIWTICPAKPLTMNACRGPIAMLHGRPANFISRTNAPVGVNTWMRWFSRSATHRLPCGSMASPCATWNLPGSLPLPPHCARNLPSLSNFSTRASPLAPGVCPCETNTSPLAAMATSVGWFSLREPAASFHSPASPFVPSVSRTLPVRSTLCTRCAPTSVAQMLPCASTLMPCARVNRLPPKERTNVPLGSNS